MLQSRVFLSLFDTPLNDLSYLDNAVNNGQLHQPIVRLSINGLVRITRLSGLRGASNTRIILEFLVNIIVATESLQPADTTE